MRNFEKYTPTEITGIFTVVLMALFFWKIISSKFMAGFVLIN